MLRELRKPPNILTTIRALSIPILWVFAFFRQKEVLGVGLIVGALTDSLDGLVARRTNNVSAFGSKFDSIADHTLQLSAVVWIFMLMPEVFSENALIAYTALAMNLLSLLVGIVKFKRIANLHLYLSKAVFGLFFVFMVHAFLAPRYSKTLLIVACVGVILASAETIILQLTQDKVDEHIGSLLLLYLSEDHPVRRLFRPRQ